MLSNLKFYFTNIKKLIKTGDFVNLSLIPKTFFKTTHLYHAIDSNDFEMVKFLVDLNISIVDFNDSALIYALSKNKNLDIIKFLIDKSSEKDLVSFIDSYHFGLHSPLSYIIKLKNDKLFDYIIDKITDKELLKEEIGTHWSFLMNTIHYGNKYAFDKLLSMNNNIYFFPQDNKFRNLNLLFSNNISFIEHIIDNDLIKWESQTLKVLKRKIDNDFHRLGSIDRCKKIIEFFDKQDSQFRL